MSGGTTGGTRSNRKEKRESRVSRREAISRLSLAAVGVAGLAVGLGGGYLAGSQLAPARVITETRTITRERTVTVTQAVGAPTKPPRNEIVIGASIALTGGFAGFGTEQKWAVEEAIRRVNAQGGVFVREYNTKLPVRLVVYDDKSDVTTAVSNIEKLITVDEVDFLLGETGSHIGLAVAPVVERYKVPLVGMIATTEKLFVPPKYNYVFSNFHLARDEVLIYFEFMNSLPRDQRPKTIAIWEEASDLGADNANWFERYAQEFGYEVVLREKYTPGSDLTELITKTKALNPDVVGSIPSPPDAINMMKISKELKFSPKLWAFTRGTAAGVFGKTLGEDAEYVTASFVWNPNLQYEGGLPYARTDELVNKYVKETGRPPALLGIHYSSVQILLQAIEKAGTLDRERVREALITEEFDTLMGRLSFAEGGKLRDSARFMLIQQWRNGRLEIVWPREKATIDFVYPFPPWDRR